MIADQFNAGIPSNGHRSFMGFIKREDAMRASQLFIARGIAFEFEFLNGVSYFYFSMNAKRLAAKRALLDSGLFQ